MEGFFGTRNCFKFAALFVGTERTEVHGTDFLPGFVWEHGTGIHRRCAHGCITEPTERESIRPAPLSRRAGWQCLRFCRGGLGGKAARKKNRGILGTRNCFKFAALFVCTERTEVHGTDFLRGFVWEQGTGIHRRYAHGCITEPTERESNVRRQDAAAPCDRWKRSLHAGLPQIWP